MKDFKKLIREAYLGNPLNEDKKPKQVNIAVVDGFGVYSVKIEFEDGSTEKFRSEEEAEEKYNLDGVPRQEFEMDVSESVNEEDRATRVDKMLSGEYEDEDYKDSKRYDDVRAELEDEINEENEKYDHIARAEYGKPFSLLSIAQKQEMLSYMNRETEKEFETDFERRRKGDYSDDREDGMTDYQRRRMDEEFKKGDKVTYLGNPAEITFVGKDLMDRTYYSVSYDKGRGKTKASNLYNKDGEIKAVKEDMNDPVLMRTRAAQMKRDAIDKKDLENKSKRISADEAIDLRYELSILDKEREDILMRIEDIGVEMEQTSEPEGGPIADKLGERLMAADKELRAVNNKIIDIKDDLGIFDMNESDLDEGTCGYGEDGKIGDKPAGPDLNEDEIPSYLTKNIIFGKAVEDSVSFNDFQKRVYGILGPKYYKLTDQGALKDFYDSVRVTKPNLEEDDELNVNVDNANDNYAKAIDAESRSGAYESLQESLRKKLQERLK